MDQVNYLYIFLPISIAMGYVFVRCYETSVIYFQEKINPITDAIEVVNATPVIGDRSVVININ